MYNIRTISHPHWSPKGQDSFLIEGQQIFSFDYVTLRGNRLVAHACSKMADQSTSLS